MLRVGIREDPAKPVFICGHCRLQFIEPRWKTEAELREYYRTEYRMHHEARLNTRFSAEQRFNYQRFFMQESLRVFQEEIPAGGSVLEIGCSAGGFLEGLKSRHEVYGSEWNPEDAAFVREKLGIPCEEGMLEDIYPGKTFNVVVAIHVFEHQPDPLAFLEKVRKKLVGGGLLYMEVPHANDAVSAVYVLKEYQDFFYRDVHLTYWLPHQLHWFFDSAGLDVRIQPMQRYGLANHLNWLLNKQPMEDGLLARAKLRPVPAVHPLADPMNRIWEKLDVEYRIALKSLWLCDSLVITGQRTEI